LAGKAAACAGEGEVCVELLLDPPQATINRETAIPAAPTTAGRVRRVRLFM
jgi:hypothetical protein